MVIWGGKLSILWLQIVFYFCVPVQKKITTIKLYSELPPQMKIWVQLSHLHKINISLLWRRANLLGCPSSNLTTLHEFKKKLHL